MWRRRAAYSPPKGARCESAATVAATAAVAVRAEVLAQGCWCWCWCWCLAGRARHLFFGRWRGSPWASLQEGTARRRKARKEQEQTRAGGDDDGFDDDGAQPASQY